VHAYNGRLGCSPHTYWGPGSSGRVRAEPLLKLKFLACRLPKEGKMCDILNTLDINTVCAIFCIL